MSFRHPLNCPACGAFGTLNRKKVEVFAHTTGRHATVNPNGWVDSDMDMSGNPMPEDSVSIHYLCTSCLATSSLVVNDNSIMGLVIRSRGAV